MIKLEFDINKNLKALPGTTSLVLRLIRLKIFVSSLPYGPNHKTGLAASRTCLLFGRSELAFLTRKAP